MITTFNPIKAYKRRRCRVRLKSAISKADRRHKKDGKRYFVIGLSKTRVGVLNRADVKKYNSKARKNRLPYLNTAILVKRSYYIVPPYTEAEINQIKQTKHVQKGK